MRGYDDNEAGLKKAKHRGKKSGLQKYFFILIIGIIIGILLQTMILNDLFSFSGSLKTCETEKNLVDNQLVTCMAKLDVQKISADNAISAEPSSVDENSFVEIQ